MDFDGVEAQDASKRLARANKKGRMRWRQVFTFTETLEPPGWMLRKRSRSR
jgi:hypothetical protein